MAESRRASIWSFFEVDSSYERVLADRKMPGAVWFPGAEINYAERAFEVLKRLSSHQNVKLFHVAQHVVDTGKLPGPPAVPTSGFSTQPG